MENFMDKAKDFYDDYKGIIFSIFFVMLGAFLMFLFFSYKQAQKEQELLEKQKAQALIKQKIEQKINFNKNLQKQIQESLNITADSYLVVDFETEKEYFYKNKNKKQPIASLTKIATSVVALENFLPDTEIQISKEHLKQTENNGLIAGEIFPIKKLLAFMMMVSSNDAAYAVSTSYENKREGFLKMMNLLANRIGMKSTLFFSESGLDLKRSNIAGSYSTVKDISLLVKYFYQNFPEFSKEFSVSNGRFCSKNLCHKTYNTNSLFGTTEVKTILTQKPPYVGPEKEPEIQIEKKPNFDFPILFSKTGYTNLAKQSLAIITEVKDRKIIIVVLGAKKGHRANDVKILTKAVEKYLKEEKK
ncbi:hypothetical protein CSB11_01440 [Candidatus Campbellbacteria bacterium]|nr:MAG: hypothetical protein CSB11_01440 [Candidatus Campbellbacteria bacterium]